MTVLTKVLIELIRENHISFTVSIDGPQKIHDMYRKFANGKGSFDRIVANIDTLAKNGITPDGFESVYTPYEMEQGYTIENIVNFLSHDFDASWVDVVPVCGWFAQDEIKNEWTFAKQLRTDTCDLFADCVDSQEPAKQFLAQTALRNLFAPSNNTVWCKLGQNTVTAAADGSIYPCYMLLNQRERWQYSKTITGLDSSSIPPNIQEKLDNARATKSRLCSTCDLKDFCRGCPASQIDKTGELNDSNPVACSYRFGMIEGTFQGWRNRMSTGTAKKSAMAGKIAGSHE